MSENRRDPAVGDGSGDDEPNGRDDGHDLGAFATTDDDARERVVCHVDMDCFYAACERLREPALRGEPLVVGMGYESEENHGAVATASYEAREFGVESAMAISEALERLPRKVEAARDPDLDVEAAGFYRPVDLDYYREVGADVKSILHDAADVVREVSIDEAYLDVTDRVDWDDTDGVVDYARRIKSRIDDEVGVVASVGVTPTMSAAKIASDHDKPDGLVVVEPGEVREFLSPLDVEEIHNVGPVTARELRAMDVETAGDLAAADPERLRDRFGERGLEVRRFARGEDPREVEPVGEPKSLSRESAFTEPTADSDAKRERVEALAADVAERAEREGALYRTIGIKVVTPPFDVNTRAESLPGPIQNADLVAETARALLAEFDDDRVRKLGVRVSNLSFAEGDQTSLSGFDGEDSGGSSDATPSDDGARSSENDGGRQSGENDGELSSETVGKRSEGSSESGADPGHVTIDDFAGGEATGEDDANDANESADEDADSATDGDARQRSEGQSSLTEFD